MVVHKPMTNIIKVQIKPTNEQVTLLRNTAMAYMNACNFVLTKVFELNIKRNVEMQNLLYYDVRRLFGLKAQMTCSVFHTVIATIKANGLDGPPFIQFESTEYDLAHVYDYNINEKTISISVKDGRRINVEFIRKNFNAYFDNKPSDFKYKFGTAKYKEINTGASTEHYLFIPIKYKDNDLAVKRYKKSYKNIKGKKFGLLTVIKRVNNTQNGKTQWLCKCECGNTKIVPGKSLRDGNTKSCGCLNNKDYVYEGRRFGKLEVIGKAENSRTGKVQWLCKCDCGKEKIIQEYALKRGIKSCGCEKKKITKEIEIGDRFGKLTIIEKLERKKNEKLKWKCKCDCGNVTSVKDYDLKTGVTKSCGCIRYKKRQINDIKIGMKFGKLTVIERKENDKRGKTRWLCECECGNKKEVSARYLRIGFVTSCGCDKVKKREVTIGKSYGCLKVLQKEKNDKRSKSMWLCQCVCGKTKVISGKELLGGCVKSCGCMTVSLRKETKLKKESTEIPTYSFTAEKKEEFEKIFEYKKTKYLRIRRIFFDGKFIKINLSDLFYKDYVMEHKDINLYMLSPLKEKVYKLIEASEKFIEHIIDAFIISFKNKKKIMLNFLFEKNFKLEKKDFIQTRIVFHNFFYFCNIISIDLPLN